MIFFQPKYVILCWNYKLILELNPESLNKIHLKTDFDYDFILITISCPLKDYRICHFINKFSGLNLEKADDHRVFIPQYHKTFPFSFYQFVDDDRETEYYLLSNRGDGEGVLVPEMKTSDYFLIIKNFIDDEDLQLLLQSINQIAEVVVASEIRPEKLKSRENLIF